MTNRQIQKEKTRKNIIDTALKVFAEKGIMQTRMSDIAEAACVAHGSLFAHFKCQEDLIACVVEEFGKRATTRTHELAAESAGLQEILEAHLKSLGEHEAFYSRLISENRLLPQAVRDTLVGIQSAVSFHISRSISAEMCDGKIKTMPVYLIFNTWLGLIHYYLSNCDLFAPEGSVLDRYGAILLEHFLNLIRKNV